MICPINLFHFSYCNQDCSKKKKVLKFNKNIDFKHEFCRPGNPAGVFQLPWLLH